MVEMVQFNDLEISNLVEESNKSNIFVTSIYVKIQIIS